LSYGRLNTGKSCRKNPKKIIRGRYIFLIIYKLFKSSASHEPPNQKRFIRASSQRRAKRGSNGSSRAPFYFPRRRNIDLIFRRHNPIYARQAKF
jgi:hypothetical protein